MRRKQLFRLIVLMISMISFALGLGARLIYQKTLFAFWGNLYFSLFVISSSLLIFTVIEFLLSNHILKGLKYFWYYWTIRQSLELQMIDAGFGITRGNCTKLPRISLSFNKDLSIGILKIRNTLKFDKKLDNIVMSSALGKFFVERHYQTDDGNYYIYELIDGATSFKIEFDSFDEFLDYNKKIPAYKLFLDKRSEVKLQHCLIVGQTGSGKTYAVYNLILQMLNKPVTYQLLYADPKGSSLAVIGNTIAPDKTAVDMAQIIALLETFVSEMHVRKTELRERLKSRLDADYSDFDMSPHVFIFDEYASFVSVLASEDKKTRDKVKSLLYEIILQGRQLGFFLFIIMQKSDATLIDTAVRDNIPLKIVLGNSEPQTYVTAFGAGVNIPNRFYMVGEGAFTEPVLAPEPKLVQCPFLNFSILQACEKCKRPGWCNHPGSRKTKDCIHYIS